MKEWLDVIAYALMALAIVLLRYKLLKVEERLESLSRRVEGTGGSSE